MNSEHNRTLIKFREVEHNFQGKTAITSEYYFIYPAFDYKENFKYIVDDGKNEKYLTKVDEDNVDLMFKEILKYNEELRLLWQRGVMFDATILKTRYRKTKVFYKILCKFILEITTMFYYSNLWIIGGGMYNGTEEQADQTRINAFGKDSKGMEFSFDKAFGFALQLEKTIKAEFNKILDILYPPITEKAIVSAVLGKGEAEQEIGKELNKGKTKKKHKSKKHHKKHKKTEPEAEVKEI